MSARGGSPAPDFDLHMRRVVFWLAGLIVVEPLLILPVIVVSARRPDLMWMPLVPYALFTSLWVISLYVYLRRSGVRIVARPQLPGLARLLVALAGATVIIAAAALRSGPYAWIWIAPYLVTVGALLVWFVRWQRTHLALQCAACGSSFRGTVRTWTLAVNMGDHKRVSCPHCGEQWARVISANDLAAPDERG